MGIMCKLFLLQHFGDAKFPMLGMAQLVPQSATALPQPSIQLVERTETSVAGIDPDTAPAILHILLDHTLFPPEAVLQKSGSNR